MRDGSVDLAFLSALCGRVKQVGEVGCDLRRWGHDLLIWHMKMIWCWVLLCEVSG